MDGDNASLPLKRKPAVNSVSLLVFPAAWAAGILSLYFFNSVFGDSMAFASSWCGALLSIYIMWVFSIRQIDRSIPFWPVLFAFILKSAFVYVIWTTQVFAPNGEGELQVAYDPSFREAYSFWIQMQKLVFYWETNGFTIFTPLGYINYDHPEAMALLSIPFMALPTYSEVLIPWNMFYTTAAAAGILALGRLENFSPRVCRWVLFLVLFQPFGWNVWQPFKRDTQCQMFFAFFLLAIVIFRRRLLGFLITAVTADIFLSFYRTVYGFIFLISAAWHYMIDENRQMGRKPIIQVMIVIVVISFLSVANPGNIFTTVQDNLTFVGTKYGLGEQEMVAEKGYQERLTGHSSWWASFPDRIALALVTPFPWTNILDSDNLFEVSSNIVEYLHTALIFVCFGTIGFFGFRDYKKNIFLPVSVIFSLGVALSGFTGYAVHNVYVQVGMLTTFPYVIHKLGTIRLIRYYIFSIVTFILSSIFWNYIR